jgi:hypothetical protein
MPRGLHRLTALPEPLGPADGDIQIARDQGAHGGADSAAAVARNSTSDTVKCTSSATG